MNFWSAGFLAQPGPPGRSRIFGAATPPGALVKILSRIKNPVKDFCYGDLKWCLSGVCRCLVCSGRWLVGPFRTSNMLFYLTRPQLALLKVCFTTTDESGQRRARTRAPKSGRTLRFIRVNVVFNQSFPSVGAFGAFLALKLSRSQRLWQGAGAVHSQHLSLHVDGARRTLFFYTTGVALRR